MLTHLNRRVFLPPEASLAVARFAATLRAAGPPLLFGLRLWASVTPALYIALRLQLEHPCSAGTALGGARRRRAALFADLAAGIAGGLGDTLAMAGREPTDTPAPRREFLRRVIALDPVIDATIGESSQIRYRSPILQQAVDGLFAALRGWRAVADHLAGLPLDGARDETALIGRSSRRSCKRGRRRRRRRAG